MSKSKPADEPAKEKPKSGKIKLVIGAVLLLALGAGGAYGAVASGLLGASGADHAEPDVPKPVTKGDHDPYAPEEKTKVAITHGEGGSEFRTAYYSFEEGFTSNLRTSPGLVQVSLAASTHHDGRVIQWLQMHELAIRSAILVELANTDEADVFTVEGKEELQKRLTAAINRVLKEQEGFGGVDAVHFRSFLVQ